MALRVSAGGLVALTVCLAWSGASNAQQVVVQQPEFQQFAVPTTVLVPDRGAAFLGGTGGAGQGRAVYGPIPMSRGTASSSGASSVQVRAYVHDFRAMDAALLGQSQREGIVNSATPRKPASPFRGLPRRPIKPVPLMR